MRFAWQTTLTFVVLVLSSLTPAQAQTATLRGVVSDARDGSSLVGANVILTTVDGERLGATATNVDGYYQLRDLSSGRRRIQFSFVGYTSHRDTLTIEPGRQTYNVDLTPNPQTLEEVKVEGDRGATQREAGVMTVGAADVERIPTPGPGGDLAAYLQTLSGVASVGDRGGDLYVRGGTPSQNLMVVDGLRIVKPFHISGLYSAFSEDLIKNADVHLGGFGAEYMGAISSVINVSLREGNMKRYQASASASPFLTSARVEGPIRKGKDSFLALGRYSVIEEAGNPLFGRDIPISFFDLTARYTLQGESASCNATGMRTGDRGRINPNRNLILSWSNTVLGARCLFFGSRLDYALDVSGGYTHFQNEAGTRTAPQRSASLSKTYLRIDTKRDLLGSTFRYGGKWTVTTYDFNLDESFIIQRGREEVRGALQAYASMNWALFDDRLTVKPSLGSQITMSRFIPSFEPRIRVSYQPDGTNRRELSLAVGKYSQIEYGITDERDAGTVFTVWRPTGRDAPLAQAYHGILGYRQQIGSAVDVSVEGYVKDLANIPVPRWAPIAKFDVSTTLANGLVYGADLRATAQNRWGYLSLGYGWSTVTYRAARDDLGAWVEGDVVSYNPAHDRRHQFNLVASTDISAFTASVNWRVTSGRPYTKVSLFDQSINLTEESPTSTAGTPLLFYDRPYNAQLPTYHRLDVSLERTFSLSGSVSLHAKAGAINSYDRKNVFYFDLKTLERVNQSPLLPYVSLRVEIE